MTQPESIGATLADTRRRLNAAGVDHAGLEARLLLADVLRCDVSIIIGHPERPITAAEKASLEARVDRRLRGEPLAYILGRREFWSLTLTVTAHTLIPRPETETLVEMALSRLGDRPGLRLLDLGTGSGCLLLALLTELPAAWGVGVDLDEAALSVARSNARVLGVEARAAFLCADWAEGLAGRFDLIVANPPYVSDVEWASLAPGVRDFEPALALRAGADGLTAYRRILPRLQGLLAPDGFALIEIGGEGANTLPPLVLQAGLEVIEIRQDLRGRQRAVGLSTTTAWACKKYLGNQVVPV
jgi:release factor glutamine methyltransferase